MSRLIEMAEWADKEFWWPSEKPDNYDIGYAVAERTMDHILEMLIEEGPERVAMMLHEEVYKRPLPTDHLKQMMEKR